MKQKYYLSHFIFLLTLMSLFSCSDNKNPFLGRWDYSNSISKINLKNDSTFQLLDSAFLFFNKDINYLEFKNNGEISIPQGLAKYRGYDNIIIISFMGEEIRAEYKISGDSLILSKKILNSEDNGILQNDKIMNDSLSINELITYSYFIRKKE